MISELGLMALILALCLAAGQIILPTIGLWRHHPGLIATARSLAYGQCGFLVLSFAALAYGFLNNDFSVVYVYEHSNRLLPWGYRFAAVWGGHEGSLLLWITLLSAWGAAVARFSRSLPVELLTRVLIVLGLISVGFLGFILQTSNPFTRQLIDVPTDGLDLNPLLQDPGLLIHPPMLYMGYVGFAVAFAFAIAALWRGQLDGAWARWTRPWTLVAWIFLTFGIVLGSWWAYNELGWGGWWFWDPVENASFLPWLTGTALIHSLAVTEKRGVFKRWTVLLAVLAFSLSLIGTFLVRSGVLTSVHAFANDPERGAYLLAYLVLVTGAALALYSWRAPKLRQDGDYQLISRETLLLTNNVILVVAMVTVLLGTLYPLWLDAMGWGKISVGPPYFNSVFMPLMTLLLLFMGAGPHCFWLRTDPQRLWRRLRYTLLISGILGLSLPWLITQGLTLSVAIGVSLAFWVAFGCIQDTWLRLWRWPGGLRRAWLALPRSQYGMMVAHVGVAVCVLGVVLSSAYTTAQDVRLSLGDEVTVGPYVVKLIQTKPLSGPNYDSVAAQFDLFQAGTRAQTLWAEKRYYPVQGVSMTEAAIDIEFFSDLYLALGEALSDGAWAVRVYYKPFVRWIWGGGLLMMLGGVLAISDKRYRRHKVQRGLSR